MSTRVVEADELKNIIKEEVNAIMQELHCPDTRDLEEDDSSELDETANDDVIDESILRDIIRQELAEAKRLQESPIDKLQAALDVVGLASMIPGIAGGAEQAIGAAADGINAVIYLARGDNLNAMFSAIGVIPIAGDIIGKGGKATTRIMGPAIKSIDQVKDTESAIRLLSKLDPADVAKLKPILDPLAPHIAKHGDNLIKFLDIIADADTAKLAQALSDLTGKSISFPGPVAAALEPVLRMAAKNVDKASDAAAGFFKLVSTFFEEGDDLAKAVNRFKQAKTAKKVSDRVGSITSKVSKDDELSDEDIEDLFGESVDYYTIIVKNEINESILSHAESLRALGKN